MPNKRQYLCCGHNKKQKFAVPKKLIMLLICVDSLLCIYCSAVQNKWLHHHHKLLHEM